jgi:hypothetical protein
MPFYAHATYGLFSAPPNTRNAIPVPTPLPQVVLETNLANVKRGSTVYEEQHVRQTAHMCTT